MTIPRRVFFFLKLGIFMLASSLFGEHDKGSNLLGIVKWSVLEKKIDMTDTLLIEGVMNMSDLKIYLSETE